MVELKLTEGSPIVLGCQYMSLLGSAEGCSDISEGEASLMKEKLTKIGWKY